MSAALKVMSISTLQGGGAGIAAYRLHSALSEVGVLSVTFTLFKENRDPGVILISGSQGEGNVNLWPVVLRSWQNITSKFNKKRPDFGFWSFPYGVKGIEKYVEHFDIIHFHWVSGIIDFRSVVEIFAGKKIVWTLHDMNPFTGGCHYSQECISYRKDCDECPLLGPGSRKYVNASWKLKQSVYKKLDLTIVTPSKWLLDCSSESALLAPFQHYLIPYGLDTKVYHRVDKQVAKNRFQLLPERHYVLFGATGIADPRKGFDLLIRGLILLSQREISKTVTLIVFGGSNGIRLPNLPFEVIFLGNLADPNDVAMAFNAADVFVVPSRADNLPNTCLESLCCGTPVVGFRIGGIPDMIEHLENGYLVDPFDIRELSAGIEWCLHRRSESFRAQISERACEKFNQARQARRYKELYTELLG